jgi:hypothetical protein
MEKFKHSKLYSWLLSEPSSLLLLFEMSKPSIH